MDEIRAVRQPCIAVQIVRSRSIGPRGDGYVTAAKGSAQESAAFHLPQAAALKEGGVDMLRAQTMTSITEATGVAPAARSVGLPVAISFTGETDGRLPSRETLREALERVDADTDANGQPEFFGINCAHPSHFKACIRQCRQLD